jgi:hypothetical protein
MIGPIFLTASIFIQPFVYLIGSKIIIDPISVDVLDICLLKFWIIYYVYQIFEAAY